VIIELGVVAPTICLLVAMSILGNRRFGDQDRLPMQWSLDGSVNWTAPRAVALAFTPLLATVVLVVTIALPAFLQPRRGEGLLMLPALVLIALVFIGAHALHLWLIRKSRPNG
jgi:hypothetical protein